MTDEKMDMNDFRREMIDRGLDDEEALESLENDRKKIHMLTFGLDNKKTNVISHVNGKVTFVDSRFPGKVEVGDVWICSVSPGNNITVNYAMPIYKVTASFLISLEVRTSIRTYRSNESRPTLRTQPHFPANGSRFVFANYLFHP